MRSNKQTLNHEREGPLRDKCPRLYVFNSKHSTDGDECAVYKNLAPATQRFDQIKVFVFDSSLLYNSGGESDFDKDTNNTIV